MMEPRTLPDAGGPHAPPSAATTEAIRAAIAADFAPLRPRSLQARGLLVAAAALGAAALTAPAPPVPGLTPQYGRGILVGAVAVVAATLGIVASFAPIGGRRLGARAKLVLACAFLACWVVYLASIARAATAAGALEVPAIGCGVRSLLAGLLLGAAAFRVFRHADPWTPWRTGALIGIAAGCVTAAGVGIGCGSADLGHLLMGHALAVPLLALAGAAAARRSLRP